MTEQFGLRRIGQVHVSVRDVDRAVEFYRDRLGMRFLFQVPNMAFFDCEGIRLYLGVPESRSFRSRATIYYTVDSMAIAVAALEARGVAFADRPHVVHRTEVTELWMCFLKDPDENNVVLMREVPTGATA